MSDIVLIDGGTGMELLARSANKTPRHWSAEFLMTEPDLVRDVHADFIRAGARVITTNNYSATYTRMSMVGAADKVPELQRTACALAEQARNLAGIAEVRIAGSLPPLNGTYRADRVRPYELNLEEYRLLVALQAPHVDVFICETMASAEEARAAATAASEAGKPVWVGWTLQDDASPLLRSGESVSAAHAALAGLGVTAVLANCAQPESITAAMPSLLATGLPTGGYANAFTSIPSHFLPGKTLESLGTRRDLDPAAYAAHVMGWVAQGAQIVGGCCQVGPAHIALLRDTLLAAGHRIVASPI